MDLGRMRGRSVRPQGSGVTIKMGQTVRVAFRFHSENAYIPAGPDVDAGWYIDEVVVATGPVRPIEPNVVETFGEADFWDRWHVTAGTWEANNLAATVLGDKTYGRNVDSRLVSPVFVVPLTNENPRLRFWHWYSFENLPTEDYGVVEIRVGAGPWQELSQHYGGSGNAAWSRVWLSLSKYAGQSVQIAFRFFSSGSRVDFGWYLDDAVLATGPVRPLMPNVVESFEEGEVWERWYVTAGTWQVGVPTATDGPGPHAGTKCAATRLGGNYQDGADTYLVSPEFVVPAAAENPRLRFWHWYRFNTWGNLDYGELGVLTPTGGQSLGRYSGSGSDVWTRPSFDLSPYEGQTVRVAFRFHSENAYIPAGPDVDAGWYIDEVVVQPVNHPPTFTKGDDQIVNEDAGTQTVPGWATAISPGPTHEASQTVSFQVENNNPGLFSAQPAVGADGTLAYTPAPDANGMAQGTVTLYDDGGTADGGLDTSA